MWCTAVAQADVLGIDPGDQWMPVMIDFSKVMIIKLSGENDFLGNDKANLTFIDGTHITIDLPYTKAVEFWEYEIRKASV